MKYAIIIPDGAADEPIKSLKGKTVLETASTPNMDWISANGRQGLVYTVPAGYVPGSDVANLSVLGYNPDKYLDGRAPLEAAARDIPLGPDDIVCRCNLVTIADKQMKDFTAGHISQPEASRIIADLGSHFGGRPIEFHEGVQYRHLTVLRNVGKITCDCTPPHDILDQKVAGYLPKGPDAAMLQAIMDEARQVLADHEVNAVRADLGENPVTDIWFWGQGQPRPFETLQDRYGIRSASVSAVDLIRGITKLAGFDQIEVQGATGYLDTNYAGKGASAAAALDDYDLVLVHVEAPDEAGHLGSISEKKLAIERVDEHVVGPILKKLQTLDEWKIMVVPDHPTPIRTRTHTSDPPPFCIAGTGVQPVQSKPFSEENAACGDLQIEPGHELLEYFLRA